MISPDNAYVDVYYKWKDVTDDPDFRRFESSADPTLCVGVAGGSQADGAAIIQTRCASGDHSQWFEEEGNYAGYGLLINYHSGKCVGVSGDSQTLLAPLIQVTCGYDHSQFWKKTWVGGGWTFVNYHSGMLLTVPGSLTTTPLPLCQYGDIGIPGQLYDLAPTATSLIAP
jgi:hypothetical protein